MISKIKSPLSDSHIRMIFFLVLFFKVIVMALFSSDYQNKLFVPFVHHFVMHWDNPWDYYYAFPQGPEFPYSPAMLYLLSLVYFPVYFFKLDSVVALNVLFKLPTLLADLAIYYCLLRICPDRKKALIYYFATPVILYACYLHSQVDLIPTAFLFVSVYLLTSNRLKCSAILFGLGLCTKFHILAALPLMAIYLVKKHNVLEVLKYLVIAAATCLFFIAPFFGEGYVNLVLNNPQQMFVYDTYLLIGQTKIYLPVLAVFIFYARYSAFRKINNDLLYTFLALVFSAFIVLTVAAPAWYVWLFPFLSIFFIKLQDRKPNILRLYAAFNVIYLFYIIFLYIPEHVDLNFLDQPVDLKITDEKLKNLFFTLLETILVATMYSFYKFGIKSNFYYIKDSPTLIGIAGDSASGKTTLLSDIKKLLGRRVLELEGDADHRWERDDKNWNILTHLNPKANLLHKQYDDIANLDVGQSVLRNDYDHSTGKFVKPRKIKSSDYIILSGLHAFYLPKMRKITDLKIYIDTDENLRKHWKVLRDMKERGYKARDVLKTMDERKTDSVKYIHPQHDFADVVIQYYTEDEFKVGDDKASIRLKLKLILNSNISLLPIISELEKKVKVQWDYSQDLENQILHVDGSFGHQDIKELAAKFVINPEELFDEEPQWLEGYRGFIQFVILLILSDKINLIGQRGRGAVEQ